MSRKNEEGIRLWLDDIRTPPEVPEGWVWAKTVEDAISYLEDPEGGEVTEASLDHDLGEEVPEGYALVMWMAEHGVWPSQSISVHSSNPPGAARMCGVIERYGPYTKASSNRFVKIRQKVSGGSVHPRW